ncbi:hypothetical protein CFC21_010330 [Triticum aestivum]|uniref:F-box domain-containing protein n=2 Tax=Triticum aestivum TaxID=4565 RepID=A0A9R1DJV5_WHEAT|nr:uncharacterized protein LOC123164959 [Triticum aestivum]KAF6993438.1 hypothetical protein CFC21_010330 [Triticum aestivum]
MDSVKEILRRVHSEKKPCVDGESHQHSPTSMPAAVSKVLEDDDLLREIIVRVGFPTTLVRASLVCKRWYHHISDRRFLRRFRERHPPRLLGFCHVPEDECSQLSCPRFVPISPQPPELAAMVSRVASYSFGVDGDEWIRECRRGSVLTGRYEGLLWRHRVHHPLCSGRDMDILPPLPSVQKSRYHMFTTILSKEDGAGGLSYMYMLVEGVDENKVFRVRVYMLQRGVWCMHTSSITHIPLPLLPRKVVLVDDKIYIADKFSDDIIVLDLPASSFSKISVPQGVQYHHYTTILSRADDASGVYLTHVHVKELQLCIWLHKGHNWLLVDTICLRQMWANLRMLDHTVEDEDVDFHFLSHVGDNAEFVFLEMSNCTLHLDVTSRTLRKVDGTPLKNGHFVDVHPFMMIWPPKFPLLKDATARTTCEGGYQEAFGWSATMVSSRKSREPHFLSSSSNSLYYNS